MKRETNDRYWVLCLCLASAGMTLPAAAPAQGQAPEERLQRVLNAWQQRQGAFRGIRYTITGGYVRPKGSVATDGTGQPLSTPEPKEDLTLPQEFRLLFDFTGKRFRFEKDEQLYHMDAKQPVPGVATTVFDRKDMFTAIPRDANNSPAAPRHPSEPDVVIQRSDALKHPLNALVPRFLPPVLFAHGLVPLTGRAPDFGWKPDPKKYFIHGQGQYAGKPCVVVRSFPEESFIRTVFDEYWVDLERDGAILREIIYTNGKVLTDLEVTWQPTPQGWLPLRWTGTQRDNFDRITSIARLEVSGFEADPAVTDADFRVAIEPGMNVWEGDKRFRVTASGSWNLIVDGVEQPSRSWAVASWGAALIAVALVLGLWFRRARARKKPAIPSPSTPGLHTTQ